MCIIPPGEYIKTLFKSSRHLNAEYTTIIAFRDALGLPERELQQLYADQSGIDITPAPGYEHVDRTQRIFFQIHKHVHSYFSGRSLEAVTSKFVERLGAGIVGLAKTIKPVQQYQMGFDSQGWTMRSDLHDFVSTHIFHAAIEALCGDHILKLCPELCREFWEFDEALPGLISGTPGILNRRALAARAALLRNIKKWHAYGRDNFDWKDSRCAAAEWEPVYGARIMRARQQMFKDLGNSEDGAASYDMGLIWA